MAGTGRVPALFRDLAVVHGLDQSQDPGPGRPGPDRLQALVGHVLGLLGRAQDRQLQRSIITAITVITLTGKTIIARIVLG